MRLNKEQQYITQVMIYAIDSGWFNYGDSVEYLPRSAKFKVVSGNLDKPIYCRYGAFYKQFLSLDTETQEQIINDFENCQTWYCIGKEKYHSYCLAHRQAIECLQQGFKVEIERTSYENVY